MKLYLVTDPVSEESAIFDDKVLARKYMRKNSNYSFLPKNDYSGCSAKCCSRKVTLRDWWVEEFEGTNQSASSGFQGNML
jgi:hypothetical protein